MNNESNNPNATQNDNQAKDQLTFEFGKVEPVTPKKSVEEKGSLFDKAKSFVHKQGSVRKEPTIDSSSSALAEESIQGEKSISSVSNDDGNTISEGVYSSSQSNWKRPETWGIFSRLPTKHRRLVAVLLLLMLLLLLIFWLKPSNDSTVQSLQAENSNALPIEFQPLNQSEELQTNQSAENDANNVGTNVSEPTVSNTGSSTGDNANISLSNNNQPITVENKTTAPAVEQSAPATVVSSVANQRSKATQPSYTNTTKKVNTVKNDNRRKVESSKGNNQSKSSVTGKGKTLVIPQGVTLMQVFRNNNLNIADVNAMTKAPGANGVLSRFQAGDKITIQLNNQGRVSRLTLENGTTFIRNADGSYRVSK